MLCSRLHRCPPGFLLYMSESEGADNAAILAARIMAVEDQELAEHRRELAEKIEPDDVTINEQ